MPVHTNPFRLYKGRLCLNHGLLVEILRCSQKFWISYKHLLDISGKRQSEVKDLQIIMQKMGIKTKKRISKRQMAKKTIYVAKAFKEGLKENEIMFNNLRQLILDDETFLYRAVKELIGLYDEFSRIDHLPDHMLHSTHGHFHALLKKMESMQNHAWLVSKAHARERVKIEELSILSTRSKRRHIRESTIELDHLRNNIEPLKEKIRRLKTIKTHEDIHMLHNDINEILKLYHTEIEDLEEIMHEGDILIRRTEKLFNAIRYEARSLRMSLIESNVAHYAKRFRRLLQSIETQARRETQDIRRLVDSFPKKPEHKGKIFRFPKKKQHQENENLQKAA